MIEHIKARVTFTTPIKDWSFSGEFSSPPGITAVIGRNGSGKSFLAIETPRYLLFGKKALRGLAADYKTYEAEGIFRIRDKRYEIKRSAKREQIVDLATGVTEAVGAEAVTAKVVELMGYPLEVFDLANAASQKQVDKLGQLRPAERKQLIDKVVGLTDYEAVERAVGDEANKLKSLAEGLAQNLRAPQQPEKPDDYEQSNILEITIKRERAARREYEALLAKQTQPAQLPSQPIGPRVSQEVVDNAAMRYAQAEALQAERQRLTSITMRAMAWPGDWTEETLEAAENRYAWEQARDARGPQPTMELVDVLNMQDTWSEIAVRRRMSDEETKCPKCGTEFLVHGPIPNDPPVGLAQLGREAKAHELWATPLPAEPKGPALPPGRAKELRLGLRMKQEHDEAQAALDKLPQPSALPDLVSLRAGVAAWQRYDIAVEAFEAAVQRAQQAQADVKTWLDENEMPLTEDELDTMQDQLSRARLYEDAAARYEKELAQYETDSAAAVETARRAAAYKEGKKAMADARTTFKALLAPRLSRIASSLIYDMTAGELSSVVVDEDMEITVDGQRIETLSGAGETVANLALRIAFGQALVVGAFPVFLGDEIDSDADEQRREATKLALLGLKKQLSQIILITHRAVDVADHVVNLDN